MAEHNSIDDLRAAIAALEAQRSVLGDAVVDTSLAALRAELSAHQVEEKREQQRKQITVLFAGLDGLSSLPAISGPEKLAQFTNNIWREMDAIILAHGGRIDKHIGEMVMALWGADEAAEDDPDRAIRAALAMQENLADIVARARLDGQTTEEVNAVSMRTGLNTGPVLLGEVGTLGEFTAMGDTVNLASRLQQACEPGSVLISYYAYRHVTGVFEVQPLAPLHIRGKTKPVRAFRVVGVKSFSFHTRRRGVAGLQTRMIGRDPEFEKLQQAYFAATKAGERLLITIIGDAGVGKSRLLQEFEGWISSQAQPKSIFRGRARRGLRRRPYGLWRNILANQFNIQDDDPPSVLRRELIRGVEATVGADQETQMKAEIVGHLLGYDLGRSEHVRELQGDAELLHNRGRRYLTEFFRSAARQSPLLLLLEDLHWADDSSLDLLHRIAPALEKHPALIVATTRPILFEKRPHFLQEQPFHLPLQLHPLTRRAGNMLVAALLHRLEEVPDQLRDLIILSSEGNPFYAEELVKMLIDDGTIITDTEPWTLHTQKLGELQVPPTLSGVLQARLDRLPAAERQALQQAAIVGRSFWDAAVAHLGQIDVEGNGAQLDSLQQALNGLRQREMIFRLKVSTFTGTTENLFKHAILREVTYESVLRRTRRRYHALAADWLIAQSGNRSNEMDGLVGDHLVLGGKHKQALPYFERAANRAARLFANEEAVDTIRRALALLPESEHEVRWRMLSLREKLYSLLGRRDAQHEDLQILARMALTSGDAYRKSEISLRKADYFSNIGDYPAAIKAAQVAGALAHDAGDLELETKGKLFMGQINWQQRHYASAVEQLEQALELANFGDLQPMKAEILRNLGIVCELQGEFAQSRSYYVRALRYFQKLGNRRGEANTLNNYGLVASDQGRYEEALNLYGRALAIFRAIGDRQGESKVLSNLGIVYDDKGHHLQAIANFQDALEIRLEIQDKQGEANSLLNLGVTNFLLGDFDHSQSYYERALVLFRLVGDRQGESMVLDYLATLDHNRQNETGALQASREALAIARDLGDRSVQAAALATLGNALAGNGDLKAADAAFREALQIRRELEQQNQAMDPLSGLARVALSGGDVAQAINNVELILACLQKDKALSGAREPLRIYLTCVRVLRGSGDERWREVLASAHQLLQERAAKIYDDNAKNVFLYDVPWHREILELWTAVFGDLDR